MTPLTKRVLATCRDREFNTIDDLAVEIPEASYSAVETTVVNAIRRRLLLGRVYRQNLLDGPILIVSNIRG